MTSTGAEECQGGEHEPCQEPKPPGGAMALRQ